MSLTNDYWKLDRLIEKFLKWKVDNGRDFGFVCAGDVLRYCQKFDLVIPHKYPILWLNVRISDAINAGVDGFELVEVSGMGKGTNFRWKKLDSEIPQYLSDRRDRDVSGSPIRGS